MFEWIPEVHIWVLSCFQVLLVYNLKVSSRSQAPQRTSGRKAVCFNCSLVCLMEVTYVSWSIRDNILGFITRMICYAILSCGLASLLVGFCPSGGYIFRVFSSLLLQPNRTFFPHVQGLCTFDVFFYSLQLGLLPHHWSLGGYLWHLVSFLALYGNE